MAGDTYRIPVFPFKIENGLPIAWPYTHLPSCSPQCNFFESLYYGRSPAVSISKDPTLFDCRPHIIGSQVFALSGMDKIFSLTALNSGEVYYQHLSFGFNKPKTIPLPMAATKAKIREGPAEELIVPHKRVDFSQFWKRKSNFLINYK
jgi:hypothetical protein